MSDAETASETTPAASPGKPGALTNIVVSAVLLGLGYLLFNSATRIPTAAVLGCFLVIVFTPLGKPIATVIALPFVFVWLFPRMIRKGGLLDHAHLEPLEPFDRWTPELASRFDRACAEVETLGFRSLGRYVLSSIEIPAIPENVTRSVMQFFVDRTETISGTVCVHIVMSSERTPEVLVEFFSAKADDRYFEVLLASVADAEPPPPSAGLLAPPDTSLPRTLAALSQLVRNDQAPSKLTKLFAKGLDHHAAFIACESVRRYVARGIVRKDAAMPGTYRYTVLGACKLLWGGLPSVQRSRVAKRHRQFVRFCDRHGLAQ